jgi:hypothetical protein
MKLFVNTLPVHKTSEEPIIIPDAKINTLLKQNYLFPEIEIDNSKFETYEEKFISIPNLLCVSHQDTVIIQPRPETFHHNLLSLQKVEDEKYYYKWNIKFNSPTFVTAFYPIRELENNTGTKIKKTEEYFQLGEFVCSLRADLVIFTNEACKEKLEEMTKLRSFGTKIIVREFHELPFFKHRDKLEKIRKEYKIYNLNETKDTTFYTILTHSKMDFIKEICETNPFGTNRFCWIDFGITHTAQEPETIYRWMKHIPEKTKFMTVNHLEQTDYKNYFHQIYHNVAAPIISGSSPYLLSFCEKYNKCVEKMFNDCWWQLEEAIMSIVQRENPGDFEYYIGEYHSVIRNYDFSINPVLVDMNVKKFMTNNIPLGYIRSFYLNHPQKKFMILDFLVQQQTGTRIDEDIKLMIERCLKEKDLNLYSYMINRRKIFFKFDNLLKV